MSHVEVADSGCWEWTGAISRANGYGRAYLPSTKHRGNAHRIAYELFKGPIPAGYHVDHVCHGADPDCYGLGASCPHRRCVNPLHLEAVTPSLNRARSTATRARIERLTAREVCPRGHALTPDNRFGISRCRECDRDNHSRARQLRLGLVDIKACGVVSRKGKSCQRPRGHEGRHHGETRRYRAAINQ